MKLKEAVAIHNSQMVREDLTPLERFNIQVWLRLFLDPQALRRVIQQDTNQYERDGQNEEGSGR